MSALLVGADLCTLPNQGCRSLGSIDLLSLLCVTTSDFIFPNLGFIGRDTQLRNVAAGWVCLFPKSQSMDLTA